MKHYICMALMCIAVVAGAQAFETYQSQELNPQGTQITAGCSKCKKCTGNKATCKCKCSKCKKQGCGKGCC